MKKHKKSEEAEHLNKKAAEKLLLISKAVDSTSDAIGISDAQGHHIYQNNALSDLFGYATAEEMEAAGGGVATVKDPEVAKEMYSNMMNGKSWSGELEMVTKSGRVFTAYERADSIEDNDGNIIGLIGIITDITERKKAEEELRHSRWLHSKSEKLGKVGGWEFDINTGKQIWTEETYNIHEVPLTYEPTVEKGINFYSPTSRTIIEKAVQRAIGQNESFDVELEIITAKGNLRSVHAIGKADKKHNKVYGFFQDITAQKQLEKELIQNEAKSRSTFDQSPVGTVLVGLDKKFIKCNSAFCIFLGYSEDELLEKTFSDITYSEDLEIGINEMKQMIEGKIESFAQQKRYVRKNGNILWGEICIRLVSDVKNKPSYFICIIQDITKRKRAEEEIKLKNEELIKLNTEKDKFFSIIAHDLRSPFNTFLGFTEMMVKDLKNMSINELQKIALSLNKSAKNLFGLLTNLLEWSLMQRGVTEFNPKKIPVSDIIYDSTELYDEQARLKEIEINISIPENVNIFADKNMMETVLRNLLSNALKFTKSGGRITISANAFKDNVVISVKDTGIGMSNELINDLFKIDKRSNRTGTDNEPSTGLGLYLCKEYAEKHGGKIWVVSEVGAGSEFMISLPMSKK